MTVKLAGALAALLMLAGPALSKEAAIASSVDAAALPEAKQTPLGLYLTPKDAAAALEADPSIVFVDVRDPVEVEFVGHPEGVDANVPSKLTQVSQFDPKKGRYKQTANPDFVAAIDAVMAKQGLGKDKPVILMCRSGVRSAAAAKLLIENGYTRVYNLVEGFEGDKNKVGVRAVNGWRNAGLPWTYKIAEEAAYRPCLLAECK